MHARGAQSVGKCWRPNEFKCSVHPVGNDVADLACYVAVIDEDVIDPDAAEGGGFVGVLLWRPIKRHRQRHHGVEPGTQLPDPSLANHR